jgi:hypothetical protein
MPWKMERLNPLLPRPKGDKDAEKMENPDDETLRPVEDHQGTEIPSVNHLPK